MSHTINIQGVSNALSSSPLKIAISDEDTGSHNSDSTNEDKINIENEWREKLKV
jgi:hypothetical protein